MSAPQPPANKTVVIAANTSWNLLHFRLPIIRELLGQGYRVIALAPPDEAAAALESMGVEVEPIAIDAKGVSPARDACLLFDYFKALRRIRPLAFLGFTPKPNIYGSIAAAWLGIPVINTITGLGTGFLSGRGLKSLLLLLYQRALRRSKRVFFHNEDDRDLFIRKGLVKGSQAAVVAGSGINLERFSAPLRPSKNGSASFLFIGRLLRDKGAQEFVEAAAIVRTQRKAVFRIVGAIEDHPKAVARELVETWTNAGTIELLGTSKDVRPMIEDSDCVVLPSYREGLPRVLLEASAMRRPVITTDVPGCRHAVEQGATGLVCEARSAAALADAMIAFIDMPAERRAAMGEAGRRKAEAEFSEERVVAAYLDVLGEIGAQ